MVFYKRSKSRVNPDLYLRVKRLSVTNSISHLWVRISDVRDDAIQWRGIRKLFAATNAVLGRLGGVCGKEKTWRTSFS